MTGLSGELVGFITDGDVRRDLTSHDDIRGLRAADAMTQRPVTIGPDATLGEALDLMERPRRRFPRCRSSMKPAVR